MTIPAPSPDPMPTPPPSYFQRGVDRIPASARNVQLAPGLPRFLGDRATIFYAWMIAMAIVGFDEWHNYKILPRPQRLWDTSLLYGLLTLFGLSDTLVPIANVFAVGYAITLLWNYYNGSGQFSGPVDSSTTQPKTGTSTNAQSPAARAGITSAQQVQQASKNALQQFGGTHGGVQ